MPIDLKLLLINYIFRQWLQMHFNLKFAQQFIPIKSDVRIQDPRIHLQVHALARAELVHDEWPFHLEDIYIHNTISITNV